VEKCREVIERGREEERLEGESSFSRCLNWNALQDAISAWQVDERSRVVWNRLVYTGAHEGEGKCKGEGEWSLESGIQRRAEKNPRHVVENQITSFFCLYTTLRSGLKILQFLSLHFLT